MISNLIIPIFILIVLFFSQLKKIDSYSSFVDGARKGLKLVWEIFPYILAILVAVELFRESGLANMVIGFVSPVFEMLGIPPQVVELTFLRPFSGSGSFAILKDIYTLHGPDSYISRCASVIMGSSDTIFYVCAVYFSKTTPKRLAPAIVISLLTALLTAVLSCLVLKVMWKKTLKLHFFNVNEHLKTKLFLNNKIIRQLKKTLVNKNFTGVFYFAFLAT